MLPVPYLAHRAALLPAGLELWHALTTPPIHPLRPPLQLVMSEIDSSSPMALQAVKALALYMKAQKEAALAQVRAAADFACNLAGICCPAAAQVVQTRSTQAGSAFWSSVHTCLPPHPPAPRRLHSQAAEWRTDPVAASNPTVLLIAGLLHALEEDWVEALRACHTGGSLEM